MYLLLGFFTINPIEAQTIKLLSSASADSLMNPVVMDNGERILYFENEIQSVGVMSECDPPKSLVFSFRNVGTKATELRGVRVFCGCTVVTYDKHIIEPGAVGEITVKYNPKNKIGTIDERIYVYTTDSELYPIVCLNVLGEVRDENPWRHLPQKIGNLRLKRRLVDFVVDSLCSLKSERIWCGNSGDVPLMVMAKELPNYVSFRVEPKILQPGEEGDIIITIINEKMGRSDTLDFRLFLEGTGEELAESFIRVKVCYVGN